MTTALVKASKMLKNRMSAVGHTLNAVDRARDIYLAQIARAEADYLDRIKHAVESVADADGEISEAVIQSAPIQEATAPM